MMRFRCPHCPHVLEVVKPTQALLCPACQQWCRIPVPEEFELDRDEVREVIEAADVPPLTQPCAHIEPERTSITNRLPDDMPLRLREDADVEAVELEVIEEGDEPRRRRKRRRRPRRRRSGGGMDLDWVSLPLILLIVMAPGALILTVLAFLIHPMAGFGCLFMMGGGTWITLIAAEDGLGQMLLVMFVPMYVFY